jgi:hypothetical protein
MGLPGLQQLQPPPPSSAAKANDIGESEIPKPTPSLSGGDLFASAFAVCKETIHQVRDSCGARQQSMDWLER